MEKTEKQKLEELKIRLSEAKKWEDELDTSVKRGENYCRKLREAIEQYELAIENQS